MPRIIGLIPARMKASRFPGKPLYPIHGRAMVEHVWHRAAMFGKWDALALCTCDQEIMDFARSKGFPSVMTADTHVRALDRVAEAAGKCGIAVGPDDIVVCVQGDEPMMRPDMIDAVCGPFFADPTVLGTVLGMHVTDEAIFRNPDTVKIVHDINGDVLYTSRAPVPYCKTFSAELGARRIYGILAFRRHFLDAFTTLPPTPLEVLEACDSNRLCGSGLKQRVAFYPNIPSFSVDSPADRALVEREIVNDPYWGKY
jgi:3-deoxy-manno-octulosonate cytidylyltransferase (CMP-KDO synthetase)